MSTHIVADAVLTVACESARLGATHHCIVGRHHQCAYRPGGTCARGIWLPECHVTMPRGHVVAAVIRPSHRYHCPCDCHATAPVGQLELFGAAS